LYCRARGLPPAGKGKAWVVRKHNATEAQLRARLSEGGPDHGLIAPGGTWWRRVQMHIAEQDLAAVLGELGKPLSA
jgi:hypothetical protein